MSFDPNHDPIRLRLRLYFGDQLMLGPGKADLLAGIEKTGSIAAAGRQMSMSYKRAWMLVEEMNGAFQGPLVSSNRGGSGGGGAALTPMGLEVLAQYRSLMAKVADLGGEEIAAISKLLRKEKGQP